MFKSIILGILMVAAVACDSQQTRVINFSESECWANIKPGSKISGKFHVYYFPEVGTFASKPHCRPTSIDLALEKDKASILMLIMEDYKKSEPLGLSAYFKIDGIVFKNRNNPKLLLQVSSIRLVKNSQVELIDSVHQ